MIYKSLLSLLFFLTLGLITLTSTDLGLALLIKAAPGKADAKHISGSLLRGATIKNFHYQYDDFSLSIDELSFDWQWPELLKQKLVINSISVKNTEIILPKSSNQTSNTSLSSIHLPIDIDIKSILVENTKIYHKKDFYLVNTLKFSGHITHDVATLKQLYLLTPEFTTTSQGTFNLHTWSDIHFDNTFLLNARPKIPILTKIISHKNILILNIESLKWLKVNFNLKNYLDPFEKNDINANWLIDTTQAEFPELKKMHGKVQVIGSAHGNWQHPIIENKLNVRNLNYETTSIKSLNSRLNFTLDDRQKIDFKLSGENITSGEVLVNHVTLSIVGAVKAHAIKANLQMFDSNFFSFSTKAGWLNNAYFLKEGLLNAGPLNLIFTPINCNLDMKDKKAITYHATLQHHSETLTLKGSAKYHLLTLESNASLFSHQFTAINTPSYRIIINPNLNVNYNNKETKISGTLNIINAKISPLDFSNTVTLTSDIVYVNDDNQPLYEKSAPSKIFMDVLVKINKLMIHYKGIDAQIFGETKLAQTPGSELSAYGQLSILKGSYKAYGQMLTIQKDSTLNFNRQIDNPQLNITASKKIKVSPEYMTLPSYQPYLIAGAQITGTADEPYIRLFSIPSGVSQQDILSYLIFGFPQSQLSKSQTSALWSAFSMIDTGNSQFSLTNLQKTIQNEFGFSEFGLSSTSEFNGETQQYESGTSFVVGKRITDNLTATYNMGILVPVNVLYLRYQLSQRWALQSDSSALGNGGDILYTIRKD